MARNVWKVDIRIMPLPPVPITPANPRSCDANQRAVIGHMRNIYLLDRDRSAKVRVECSFHLWLKINQSVENGSAVQAKVPIQNE